MEKQRGQAQKQHGEKSLGVSTVGQTVSARLMGVSDMAPACQLCGGEGLEKGQWPLLALMPDTSVSSSMSLVPFKLPPRRWSSEGVSVSR